VSVTEVNYSEKNSAIQITSRYFIDDMNTVLSTHFDRSIYISDTQDKKVNLEYIEKYIRSKFFVKVNNVPVAYTFVGMKQEADLIICYIEIPKVASATLKSIAVDNEVLVHLYEEQKNILHFNILGQKKSFVLMKQDARGLLKI